MMHAGVDIGGTNIAMGLVDENCNILYRLSRPFPKSRNTDQAIEQIVQMLKELCAQAHIRPLELGSVGLAVPGSVDAASGTVRHAWNLGFHDTPLVKVIFEALGLPVFLANDANAATLAELKAGVLQGCQTAVLITLGTGVGGGLVLGGRVFNGGRNQGCELGHMVLRKGGMRCTCGRDGCIEAYCAATRLCRDFGTEQAKDVFDQAREGDERALALFHDYVDDLGSALASVTNLLDPERIAVGGGVSHAGEYLLKPLRKNVEKKCFFESAPAILCAKMGNDAGIIGAAMLADHTSE